MANNLVTSKLEMFLDRDSLMAGLERNDRQRRNGTSDDDLLMFLLRMVRPGIMKIQNRQGMNFDDFLENYPGHSIDCYYNRPDGSTGLMRIFNCLDEEMSLDDLSKEIASFFLEYKNRCADLCILCEEMKEKLPYVEDLGIFTLVLRIENIYEDGRREIVEPKGRLLVAKLGSPKSK
ncbi:MAG: hypothetical protein ACI4SL_07820 [Candidatus Ornithospirochaeta sp.]